MNNIYHRAGRLAQANLKHVFNALNKSDEYKSLFSVEILEAIAQWHFTRPNATVADIGFELYDHLQASDTKRLVTESDIHLVSQILETNFDFVWSMV